LLNDLRKKIPWFPSLDVDACRSDLVCLNFCPHDVFEWDSQSGRPVVAHPLRCLPGCRICVEGCTTSAISLPTKHEFQITLKRLRDRQSGQHTQSPR
jgi:NAD-dependent dihydropyrimidine dehydrogenase PreA subunit